MLFKEASGAAYLGATNVPSECLFMYFKARMKGRIMLAGGIPDEQVAQECIKRHSLQGPKRRRCT
jgi:hypothetical protein